MYCGIGGGVCQALFLGWQTDTDADADVYCINTIDIYKRGVGESQAVKFLGWLGGWTVGGCRGLAASEQRCVGIMQLGCQSVSVWRHLSPTRKMDSISKGDPF